VNTDGPLAVDQELERLLARGHAHPGSLPTADHEDLWRAFSLAAQGGKRFRPELLLATHAALGGSRQQAAVQVGAAIEALHTAFVVQDDVIDGDRLRRGVPNLSGTYAQHATDLGATRSGVQRYADAAGILAGDLGLVAAFRAIARCDAPAETVDRLLDLFESTLQASAAGELADVRLQLDRSGGSPSSPPLRDVLTVAELKTAVYSFQLPLHAGALLADADPDVLTALDEIGGLLGIGFQLIDDLLGVFGDERRTGKSALGDLREGKRTALLAHAATTPVWHRVHPLIGREDLGADDAHHLRGLLTQSGSRRWTEDLARWHLTSAVGAAARHHLPAALVRALDTTTHEILRAADSALLPAAEVPGREPLTARTGQPA
jgi:geranylgeranyl diphosphate synthase, type II